MVWEDLSLTHYIGCAQLVDDGCLHEWYGQNEPAKLLNMMQFTFPFCRRKPTVKTLVRYNRRAAVLGGLQAAMEDRQFLYAWCTECACAKRAYERTACTKERVPPITCFRCKECRAPRRREREQQRPPRIIACPNTDCGYAVEKVDGCNHRTCVCGIHFCYACGRQFKYENICNHMSEVQGSFFGDDDYTYPELPTYT